MENVLDRMLELRERLFGRLGRRRAKRRPDLEEPPALAGAGVPRVPRIPVRAGGAARSFPPKE